jgi:6-phosphofructokinase 2
MNILTVTLNPVIDISASVKRITPERKLRCESPLTEPGGGGINISKALRNLCGTSIALYFCGGYTGQKLIDLMDKEEVESYPISIGETTRENFSVIDNSDGSQYRFVMPGPKITEQELRKFYDAIRYMEPHPDIVAVSGSAPPGVPVDVAANIANMGKELGFKTAVDMKGEHLVKAIEAGIFFAKPNITEFRALIGNENAGLDEIERVARRMIYNGHCEMLLVSLAEKGALFVSEEKVEHIKTIDVEEKSKVGAGDSMTAGVLCAISEGKSLYEAALYGTAAGTAAVLTPGSKLCTREDTDDIYKKLLIENEAVV